MNILVKLRKNYEGKSALFFHTYGVCYEDKVICGGSKLIFFCLRLEKRLFISVVDPSIPEGTYNYLFNNVVPGAGAKFSEHFREFSEHFRDFWEHFRDFWEHFRDFWEHFRDFWDTSAIFENTSAIFDKKMKY